MLAILFALGLAAGAGTGEVLDASKTGFTSNNSAQVSLPPDTVYRVLVDDVGRWWNADHTYSGDSANLSIAARAGGCFCETLADGGSVQHMEVVYAEPGSSLRLRGGLGPLQAMAVAGAMTFALEANETGTRITLTYVVGGYSPATGGLGSLAEAVDSVVGAQLQSLTNYLDEMDER